MKDKIDWEVTIAWIIIFIYCILFWIIVSLCTFTVANWINNHG